MPPRGAHFTLSGPTKGATTKAKAYLVHFIMWGERRRALDKYGLIVSMLHANDGVIKGRTVVQKIAYFANLQLDIDGIRYRDYFYGPFSREVALGLEHLVSSLFVRETVRATPIEQYTYELTVDGTDLAAKIVEECPRENDVVRSVLSMCKEHCSLHARPLSCAAKVHFIRENEPEHATSPSEIREMARDFGWNMTSKEIDYGMTLLDELEGPRVAA